MDRRRRATLRFGDITEQHESLEWLLNLCSQGHTHLRGRPALVPFQRRLFFFFRDTQRQSDGVAAAEDGNHELLKQKGAAFAGQRGRRSF